MIACTYERRGARIVGRCPEYGLAAEGLDRGEVEAELVRMVTRALGVDEFRCFEHAATDPPRLYFRPMVQAFFMWRGRRRRCSTGMGPAPHRRRWRHRRPLYSRPAWLLRDWSGPLPRLR